MLRFYRVRFFLTIQPSNSAARYGRQAIPCRSIIRIVRSFVSWVALHAPRARRHERRFVASNWQPMHVLAAVHECGLVHAVIEGWVIWLRRASIRWSVYAGLRWRDFNIGMVPKATEIRKTRKQLEGWLRASTTEQRMVRRARIILSPRSTSAASKDAVLVNSHSGPSLT